MTIYTKNPWKTLKTTTMYDNPWIKVEHNRVINPAGKQGIYGVVHFKNYAIGIVPLDQDLNIYLVGQYRYALEEYSWEIPEGGGLKDVSILDSAKRELMEEVGLTAKKWQLIQRMHISNCVTDELAYVFIAQDLREGAPMPEETEQLTIKKMPFMEAYDLVLQGKITDAISVAAILRVKILLDEGTLIQ